MTLILLLKMFYYYRLRRKNKCNLHIRRTARPSCWIAVCGIVNCSTLNLCGVASLKISDKVLNDRYSNDHLIHLESVSLINNPDLWPSNNPARYHNRVESIALHQNSIELFNYNTITQFKTKQFVRAREHFDHKIRAILDCIDEIFTMECGSNEPWPIWRRSSSSPENQP